MRILFYANLLISGFLLVACGGGSSNTDGNTAATTTYWKFSDAVLPDTYVVLSDTGIITRTIINDAQYQCTGDTREFRILSISNNQYTLQDVTTLDTNTAIIEQINGQLKYQPVAGSNTSYFLDSVDPSLIPVAPSCVNTGAAGTITLTMSMDSLPSTISINNSAVSDDSVEYGWSVSFDINKTGILDEGDLELDVKTVKRAGGTAANVAIASLDASLSRYRNGNTSVQLVSVPFTVDLDTNTISFVLNKSLHRALDFIQADTQLYFVTQYIDTNNNIHHDYYPSNNTYSSVMDLSNISDPQGDVTGAVNTYPFIDLVSMSLTVTP